MFVNSVMYLFPSNIVCLIKIPYNKYEPKPKFRLCTMDAHIDLPISTSSILKNKPVAICCSSDGSKLFVAFKNSNKIRIYDTNELTAGFKIIKTVKDPIAINRSIDGNKLVVTGSEKIEIFNTEQEILSEEVINLPSFFKADKMVLCTNDASAFLISSEDGSTYFYNNEKFTKIVKRSDADVSWDPRTKRILIAIPKKSIIAIYETEELGSTKRRMYVSESTSIN